MKLCMNTPYECLQVQYSNFLIFCMVATWYSRVNPSKKEKNEGFFPFKKYQKSAKTVFTNTHRGGFIQNFRLEIYYQVLKMY